LHIPDRYTVVGKRVLEPFWEEFEMSSSYWRAAVKNIIGFVPLGFCLYPFLAALGRKRPAITAVCIGLLVSLMIEVSQIFLPHRDSGPSDLITNALGTWLGVLAAQAFPPANFRDLTLETGRAKRLRHLTR